MKNRFTFALLAGLLTFAPSLAQPVLVAPAQPIEVDIDNDALVDAQQVVRGQVAISDDNFDQWIFQNHQGGSATARQRLDSMMALNIENVDKLCNLTKAQRNKLELAGRGDIKNFFVIYDKAKARFDALKHDQQKLFQEVWQDISPLQVMWQTGLFNDGSFLEKSLRNTLTPEQYAIYEASTRERRSFHLRATIELAVTMLEHDMPLLSSHREELIALLIKSTGRIRGGRGMSYYVVMYNLSQIPEDKIKPLFDDMQWKSLSKMFNQYKQLRQALKQSNQWPEEDDDEKSVVEAPVPENKR